MALQFSCYSNLSLPAPFPLVSAPTCLQPTLLFYCLLFLSAELVPLWACCQALQLSLFCPFLDSSPFSSSSNWRISRNIETTQLNLWNFFCKFGHTWWVWRWSVSAIYLHWLSYLNSISHAISCTNAVPQAPLFSVLHPVLWNCQSTILFCFLSV